MFESRCGIQCTQCDYAEKMNCKGCLAMNNPFWGTCDVKNCCEQRKYDHCGQCPDFPCDELTGMSYAEEEGDNGKRIETCRMWAAYPGIGTAALTADEVISVLETEKSLILATCANNRVAVHQLSHVNDRLTVYFQTGRDYLKTRQIRANPQVAMYVGRMQMEGTATILGHPMDSENTLFMKKYAAKFPDYTNYSSLPEEIVIRVEITSVRQWRYVDGKPYIAMARFAAAAQYDVFDPRKFLSAVTRQDADALRKFFTPDAVICWHDSKEQFTVEEYIRANCEYPDEWSGEVVHTAKTDSGMIIVSKIFSDEMTVFVTSVLQVSGGKITRADEYYADYNEDIPQWRKDMNIGRRIE